ncbi:MAG: hypothetical protein HN904_29490, partial [Victivallales bacterium]|nr:hypothetical protein [Victivallales bacterium]
PTLSYLPEAHWPNLNATLVADAAPPTCQVVVSAPLTASVQGVLTVTKGGASIASRKIHLKPGGRTTASFPVEANSALVGGETTLNVKLKGTTLHSKDRQPAGTPLPIDAQLRSKSGPQTIDMTVEVPIRLASKPIRDGVRVEAETIAKEGGGKVHIREDKKGVVGKAISHWDDAGHWLEWSIAVPKAGAYSLLVRYASPHPVARAFIVDGRQAEPLRFPGSGGFGSHASEWDHAQGAQKLSLSAGQHTFRLENTDGKGLNLDYLLLQPMRVE